MPEFASEIAAWLRDLGLERYEGLFRDAEITPGVLPDLTETDLRELGLPLGPRRILLKAAQALDARPAAMGHAETTREEAERRQLTVLFVDLVDSTALSSRLDPEEMQEVILAYQQAVAGEITRHDGHVAKYMGDGVLAYFGWPRAHGDEAERAVRAALNVTEAVSALEAPGGEPLAARAGIATGSVVVGDVIGKGEARERTVVGKTPNLAARLQALAEPGVVLISKDTRRLLGNLFKLRDVGSFELKGLAEPVHAWSVLGANPIADRFEALHAADLTPLVGREPEIAVLLDRWQLARGGEGQVVLLNGEPGIGKSRAVLTLRQRMDHRAHLVLNHQCLPSSCNSALRPVIEGLERAAGIGRRDSPRTRLDRITSYARTIGGVAEEITPWLAELVSGHAGLHAPAHDLSPQQRKARILDVLMTRLRTLAARYPLLVIFEDAHWIDPTSRERLERYIEHSRELPMLLVVTLRPGATPLRTGQATVTSLTLSRLGQRQSATMVGTVAGGGRLPDSVIDQILAKADGVPLFVEELTKVVLESGLLVKQNGSYALEGPLPAPMIPATLQDSLTARLDHLGPAKAVAQIGAVIGREFSYELIAAAAGLPDKELQAALGALVSAQLVFHRGDLWTGATFIFKHALVQDAAYKALLRTRREELHAHVARVLETGFGEIVRTRPEVIAHHFTMAGLAVPAVAYWRKAGELSIARSAYREATAHLGRAIDLLGLLPQNDESSRLELTLQSALGSALIASSGYAASETGRAFVRAWEIGRAIGDVEGLLPVLNGRWLFHVSRAELAETLEVADELLNLGQQRTESIPLLIGHRALASSSLFLGRLDEARTHSETVLTLYKPDEHRRLAGTYTIDFRVWCLAFLAHALHYLGHPVQAEDQLRAAAAWAEEVAQPVTFGFLFHHLCLFHQRQSDAQAVAASADELLALSAKHCFPFWTALGLVFRGWASVALGQVAIGLAQLQDGVAAYRATRGRLYLPYVLARQAEACREAQRPAEGLSLLAEAVECAETHQLRLFDSELHLCTGELLLTVSDPNVAEAAIHFERAITAARQHDAKLCELRAAMRLARLRRDQGQRAGARDLLAPVYAWFTEGLDTPDLRDARALLIELDQTPDGSPTG